MDSDKTAKDLIRAKQDFTYPSGPILVNIVMSLAVYFFSHDFCRRIHTDTWIDECSFGGMNAVILPWLRIGGEFIGAGSVVT